MKKIYLFCGAGMSSGFLAQSMKKAAKKRKIPLSIKAASESSIDSYIDDADILLVGPHMTYSIDIIRKKAEEQGVVMEVIPEDIYGTLDGDRLINFTSTLIELED